MEHIALVACLLLQLADLIIEFEEDVLSLLVLDFCHSERSAVSFDDSCD